MYNSNFQFYNITAFWLLLLFCLLELSLRRAQSDESKHVKSESVVEQQQPPQRQEEQFPHLLDLIDATRRIHIVSEFVLDGKRLQVEEYLDLNKFHQLIQFKWHEKQPSGDQANEDNKLRRLKTHKFNSLLLNGIDRSVLYHYEPYKCLAVNLSDNQQDAEASESAKRPVGSTTLSDSGPWTGPKTAHSALNMLFMVKLTVPPSDSENTAQSDKWVSSVAGLWLKAQAATSTHQSKLPFGPKHVSGANLTYRRDGVWHLEMPDGLVADYYVQKRSEFGRGSAAAAHFEAPLLIELRNKNKVRHTINILNIEFNYSTQLDKNLFKLPIGFNCPANVLHAAASWGIYFRDQRSQLMELELVASRAVVSPTATTTKQQYQTDVRNIELARTKHPMEPKSSLSMFRSLADGFRVIQDNSYQLEYKIYSFGATCRCDIEHLQLTEGLPRDDMIMGGDISSSHAYGSQHNGRLASINPIDLVFSNGVQLDLSEFQMDFLLGLHESNRKGMRLLNEFFLSEERSEMVYEAEVPSEHSRILKFIGGGIVSSGRDGRGFGQLASEAPIKMRIVRVFKREIVRSGIKGKYRGKGLVDFARATLFVLNGDASEILAEVRVNLLEDVHVMSFARRARLFDLSACRDMEQESMRLVAR